MYVRIVRTYELCIVLVLLYWKSMRAMRIVTATRWRFANFNTLRTDNDLRTRASVCFPKTSVGGGVCARCWFVGFWEGPCPARRFSVLVLCVFIVVCLLENNVASYWIRAKVFFFTNVFIEEYLLKNAFGCGSSCAHRIHSHLLYTRTYTICFMEFWFTNLSVSSIRANKQGAYQIEPFTLNLVNP